MNIRKFLTALSAICAPAILVATVPEVNRVTMTQARDRTVTIAYNLSEPAVVTLDLVTNSPAGWVSIGVENVMKVSGDVWKLVSGGDHEITWHPDKDWTGNTVKLAAGGVKAVVTAWATDDTPDYMVVDISSGVAMKTVNFYPSEAHLPGGLLGNDAYRLTKIVMRRINAANVLWTMGSNFESGRSVASEAAYTVSLARNYYIGVFELTQGQFTEIIGSNMSSDAGHSDSLFRPLTSVSYNKMRCAPCTSAGKNDYLGGGWPNPPYADSFLDQLRTRTGVDFDLPTEAEWEFACRSGTHEGQWNDGSAKTDANLPGEWLNGQQSSEAIPQPCGLHAPSKWGLYDMHGNVYELCHDWSQDDITGLGGVANVDPSNPLNRLDGTTGSTRVRRGGACHTGSYACSASIRNVGYNPASGDARWGYRLVCPVGIAE